MRKRLNLEVIPNEGQWTVRHDKATRALKNFLTRQDALDYASERAKRERVSLSVKDEEGEETETYDYRQLENHEGE